MAPAWLRRRQKGAFTRLLSANHSSPVVKTHFANFLLHQLPPAWRAVGLAGLGWIPGDPRREGAGGDRRLPLQHFLRLMAGARMHPGQPVGTNEDLVSHLRRSGAIKQ